MIDAHLIVDVAFCAGFVLAFNPARKFLGKFLSEKQRSSTRCVEESSELAKKLDGMLVDAHSLRDEVRTLADEVLRDAEAQCRSVIKEGKKHLEEMLESQIDVAVAKIELQIENFVKALRAAAVDAASGVAKNLLKEYLDSREVDGNAAAAVSVDDAIKKLH